MSAEKVYCPGGECRNFSPPPDPRTDGTISCQPGFYYPILGRVGTQIPCPFSDQLWTLSVQGIQILGTAQKKIRRESNIEGCSSLPLFVLRAPFRATLYYSKD